MGHEVWLAGGTGRRIIKESAAPALIGCTHQHQLDKGGGPRDGQEPTMWFHFSLAFVG